MNVMEDAPDPAIERSPWDPAGLPVLRMIVSPSRTGSTPLLRAFANHPDVFTLYQPIKSGQRATGVEDHRIYGHHPVFDEHPDKAFVVKEVTAYVLRGRPLIVFPGDAEMRRVRPVFLVRDPVRTWRSWKKLMFDVVPNLLDRFVEAFLLVHELDLRCRSLDPSAPLALTLERLIEQPEPVLRRICRHWGLRYAPTMLHWSRPVEHNMRVETFERDLTAADLRWWSSVRRSTTITHDALSADDPRVEQAERERIEDDLRPAYEHFRRTEAADA